MRLFDKTPQPTVPRSKQIADDVLAHAEPECLRRIENHVMIYRKVWDDPICTPAEIIAEMGDKAARFLAAAQTNVEQIIGMIATAGADPNDYFPAPLWLPRLPLTANADGTVTVGTVDGLDAWGRPLPVDDPQPEPEPEPTPEP